MNKEETSLPDLAAEALGLKTETSEQSEMVWKWIRVALGAEGERELKRSLKRFKKRFRRWLKRTQKEIRTYREGR